ncbi:hypothetical protein NEMBOFW57_009142 [Staphylotrichum longicolle]|uniref:MYND-type domain-containing protein n=1 Tax=Staphylotrichum longicolle TaxID=669026 RepID=A0AAD4ET16_9PEZI|nr:hypothetical protein NEMBOFW57_009142 [Staphylotrichum longicolle]
MATPRSCANPACPQPPPTTPTLLLCSRCRTTRYCSQSCQAASWASHKHSCNRQNYILKFIFPRTYHGSARRAHPLCPADAPFYALHAALQIAFGLPCRYHSFDFTVKDPNYILDEDPEALMTMIMRQTNNMNNTRGNPMGDDADMPREYELRLTDPAEGEHAGIDRMHEGRRRHPRTLEKNSGKWALWKLFDKAEYQGKKAIYTNDFGDNWEHHITVEGRAEPTDDFVCLSGTGHPVAEDVGGCHGWNELKDAYRTQQPSREQREKREWFEKEAVNGDPEGLAGDRVNAWDMNQVNQRLRAASNVWARATGQA